MEFILLSVFANKINYKYISIAIKIGISIHHFLLQNILSRFLLIISPPWVYYMLVSSQGQKLYFISIFMKELFVKYSCNRS